MPDKNLTPNDDAGQGDFDPDALLSSSEAAEILGVTDGYIRQMILRNPNNDPDEPAALPAFKIGQRWVVRRGDLEPFINEKGTGRPRSGKP